MCEVLRADDFSPICSYAQIAKLFGVKNAQTIRHQAKVAMRQTHQDGRPSLFSAEVKSFIYNVINERYKAFDPISTHEMVDLLTETYGIAVSVDTFRHYVYRDNHIRVIKGEAMESRRVEINFQEIKDWYNSLADQIKSIPRNFVFNMDESGIDEYVDQQNIFVLVPHTYKEKKIPIPVHRHVKRATLTACISLAGDSLKPFVILPRGTIDDELFYAGYTPDKVTFHHQVHSFMTKNIFELWMQTIFFPALDALRAKMKYAGQAILILDKFAGHIYEDLNEQCAAHNLILKYLVPHTSHLCQPLDLITFASLKKNFSEIKFDRCRTPQSNKIVRLLRAWQKSCSVDSIVATFEAAGIVPDRSDSHYTYFCTVNLTTSMYLSKINETTIQPEISLDLPPTEDTSQGTDIAEEKISKHRPNPYPPKAAWTNDSPHRIPVNKFSDSKPDILKYNKPSASGLRGLAPTSSGGSRQLTLFQTIQKEKPKAKKETLVVGQSFTSSGISVPSISGQSTPSPVPTKGTGDESFLN
jgi:hypothetical protein